MAEVTNPRAVETQLVAVAVVVAVLAQPWWLQEAAYRMGALRGARSGGRMCLVSGLPSPSVPASSSWRRSGSSVGLVEDEDRAYTWLPTKAGLLRVG